MSRGRPLTAALPPALIMSMPHLAARGWVQATMPLVLCTTLRRLGHFINSAEGGGYTDGVVRGMVRREECAKDRRAMVVNVKGDLGKRATRQQTGPYKYWIVVILHSTQEQSLPPISAREKRPGSVRLLSADHGGVRREPRAGPACCSPHNSRLLRASAMTCCGMELGDLGL